MDFFAIAFVVMIVLGGALVKGLAFLGGDGTKNEAARRAVGWGLGRLFK